MPSGVYERKNKPAQERFWKYVNKNAGSDCWDWTAAISARYGCFWVDGKIVKAHRFSYELNKGPIPENMVVMHICDNTKCVNPNHLSVGTNADNSQDMKNKNRQAKGSLAGNAKLTEQQVKEIREKLNLGIRQIDIAKDYNIDNRTISAIKVGKSWAHVE